MCEIKKKPEQTSNDEKRDMSQPEMREWLQDKGIDDEDFLKYMYDGYLYKKCYKPIRKKKIRDQIKLEFHKKGLSKTLAYALIDQIIREGN